MKKLYKDLDQMEYGYYMHILIGLSKSIEALKKYDFSTGAILALEKELDRSIDLFYYMSNKL
tara:strand:+ start:446 stop:631 length:186 start_codon:yes stop_codon:yes gene_type:complete